MFFVVRMAKTVKAAFVFFVLFLVKNKKTETSFHRRQCVSFFSQEKSRRRKNLFRYKLNLCLLRRSAAVFFYKLNLFLETNCNIFCKSLPGPGAAFFDLKRQAGLEDFPD